jgi:PAS domain S-box-containing protein
MTSSMDWAAIASILGERSERPLVLLDRLGRIRMFNRAMEHVLGWSRFEVEGQLWARACTPSDRYDEARRWIGDALRGALRSYDAECHSSTGSRFVLRCEFSLVGRGPTQGLLITAAEWKAIEAAPRVVTGCDLDYEVADDPTGFGLLAKLLVDGEKVRLPQTRAHCHLVIHGLPRPCDSCPVRGDTEFPRLAVRCTTSAEGSARYEIVSAEKLETGLVRVRSRHVDHRTLEAIHSAKVEQLSLRAELSVREREVLTYLLLGRTAEDIAGLVGIAERTVKYHQSNVLQKLGADSRVDLLRLLF